MAGPAVPHLAVPFDFDPAGNAKVLAQDSLDEVTQAVEALCATVIGERLEVPGYGVPDQTFSQQVNPGRIAAAVAAWEPRAVVAVTADQSTRDAQVSVVVSTTVQPPARPVGVLNSPAPTLANLTGT